MAESSQKQRGKGAPFQKGRSGNPGGRPKAEGEVRELARQRGPEAFDKLCSLMDSANPTVALRACEAVLDRAYGRPKQSIGNDDGKPIEIKITRRILMPENRG